MILKTVREVTASARQESHGCKSDRAIEVLVFDPSGQYYLGIASLVPPELPAGGMRLSKGVITDGPSLKDDGSYVLVDPVGRARHVVAKRDARGTAFVVRHRERNTYTGLEFVYVSRDVDADGTPTTCARYKIIPARKRLPAGVFRLGVLPRTEDATVDDVHVFLQQAWRELFGLLDAAHPGTERRVTLEATSDVERTLMHMEAENGPGLHHEDGCPLRAWSELPEVPVPACECIDIANPLLDGDDYYDVDLRSVR